MEDIIQRKENSMSEPDTSGGKEPRDYHWYVFLHDNGDANEIVARALNVEVHNEERLRTLKCADGKKRTLWRVSFPETRIVRNAGSKFKFKVTVYSQEGEQDPRPWVDPNLVRHKQVIKKMVKRAG